MTNFSKKIVLAAASASLIEGFTKFRMECTTGGQIRIKPTNRVVSKDLTPIDGMSAVIPQRYFEQAKKVSSFYDVLDATDEQGDNVIVEQPVTEAPAVAPEGSSEAPAPEQIAA